MTHPMLAVLGMSVAEILIILVVGLFTFVVVPVLVVLAAILFLRSLERRRRSPLPPSPPPMATPPLSRCPRCGTPLPAGALAGLCPACLLKQGAADTATQPEGKPSAPLPVAEVARLFPQLEILEFIGQGGMGTVYKARQPALDRLVALKLLPAQTGADPGFAERFSQEARALAHLSHPNIVAIYDFGTAGGMNYFLMEFVDGVNLRQLQRSGRVSPREALQIVPQICDALQYAHDEGVVHRDIKPENVLVDRKGRVKIADFGLAKILGRETLDFRLTREGQVMGTPHYMAPEQVEHPLAVDHRADIYALGVVFYEMLTGELPLGRFQPPSRKVQVDVRLDEVVLHALEKEPERRYQHASEVKTAVETIAQTPVSKAKNEPSKPWGGVPMFNNRHIRVGMFLAVAGLLLIGVLRYTILRSHRPRETVQNPDAEIQVLATAAYNGDFAVRLACLGSVDSSNSVVFSIPDRAVQEVVKRFDAGQLLTVEAEDRDGKTFGHGSLRGVDNQIDTATGTLKCTATLVPDGNHLMLRGLFLNIHLTLEVKHGVTLVPAEAIRRDTQGPFVWAIKPDQTVSRRPVQVGTIDGAKAEIQSVLPGELVVIGPANSNLHDGQKIPYKLVKNLAQAKSSEVLTVGGQIQTAFDQLRGLKGMKPGQRYELEAGGKQETGGDDDFLRRRTGSEILASGLSSGCGDYAFAFAHLMQERGFQTLLVDSAEISLRSLEDHFSGHVVIAVRDPVGARWLLADPTNHRILSTNWSTDAKTFGGDRYWIGYCGPPAQYPAHDPGQLKEFYAKTLSSVPKDFWNEHIFRFNFKVDASLVANDGSYLNPNVSRLAGNQEQALAKFGIQPEERIKILLVKGGNDFTSTLDYSSDRGWVCSVGLQSGCGLGFISYLQEKVASTMPR